LWIWVSGVQVPSATPFKALRGNELRKAFCKDSPYPSTLNTIVLR
jgi:hypothetical protein